RLSFPTYPSTPHTCTRSLHDALPISKGQIPEVANLAQIDRSYWLAGDPLPVTEANLLRGKEVFLQRCVGCHGLNGDGKGPAATRSEEHTSELQSRVDLVCRLLLEKKK